LSPGRTQEATGLVQRDYGNIHEDCFDALVDTDTLTIPQQITLLRRALEAGPTGGADRLKARIHREAQRMNRREFEAEPGEPQMGRQESSQIH
jgi:hypothetical protein